MCAFTTEQLLDLMYCTLVPGNWDVFLCIQSVAAAAAAAAAALCVAMLLLLLLLLSAAAAAWCCLVLPGAAARHRVPDGRIWSLAD